MSGNNEAAPPHAGFTCFNVNCYTTFRTERGLRQHLWRSDACREYMSLPRPLVADSVNITVRVHGAVVWDMVLNRHA